MQFYSSRTAFLRSGKYSSRNSINALSSGAYPTPFKLAAFAFAGSVMVVPLRRYFMTTTGCTYDFLQMAGVLPSSDATRRTAVTTFFLVLVVFGTAVDPRAPKGVYSLAIGLTVALWR